MNLDFSAARVLVVGDLMLDSYWQGRAERISPEAPVPVVRVEELSWRVGGAGNVAVNVAALGGHARLFGVIGDDDDGRRLRGLLDATTIAHHCQVTPGLPTTTKLRVLSKHQQLIRPDFEQTRPDLDLAPLLEAYRAALGEVDVVVLSDYDKGMLQAAQSFIRPALAAGCRVLVDPKKRDFADFAGASLVTPNQAEFEAVVGPCEDVAELAAKAARAIDDFGLEAILVTRGEQGMTLVMRGQPAQHFAAEAREVYDVTGAGDTVIAALATGLASGLATGDAVFLAGKAAAIVVGRVGTAAATAADIAAFDRAHSNKISPIAGKIVGRRELLARLDEYRAQGMKIVATNGCFDLLHIGHLRYLEQAAALGDVLVVAVNGDASVARLKGAQRPINPLADRMELLAGLASVDLVVDFDEDTPEALLADLRPDILVKGGDYREEEIAGRQYAGEVRLLDFIDGRSSSDIVARIRRAADDPD